MNITVSVECTYTASNVPSFSSSSSAGVEVVQATDFFAISFFRSAMALLSILHSDSILHKLITKFTLRSRLLILLFHSILLLHCMLIHSACGISFFFSLSFLLLVPLTMSLANTVWRLPVTAPVVIFAWVSGKMYHCAVSSESN